MDDPDSFAYFQNKRSDRGYLSKRFTQGGVAMRFLSQVVDSSEHVSIGNIAGESVLHVSPGERQEIKALFCEVDRRFRKLIIQKYNRETGKPLKQSFSFDQAEIEVLREVLDFAETISLDDESGKRFGWADARRPRMTEEQKRTVIQENPELVEEALRLRLTKKDLVALGYRKEQVELFGKLLESDEFFHQTKMMWRKHRDEDVWQQFFENNKWIFGHSLGYLSLASLDDRKLEQVVAGYDFTRSGKRVDALMKSRGILSSLCFVEIKTHSTPLLDERETSYRRECWPISPHVAGSLAQVHKTVHKAVNTIDRRVRLTDRNGAPTGEEVFLYNPRAYLVVGSLAEFHTPQGLNEEKHSSFELWRRDQKSVEVITFDELFMRAEAQTQSWDEVPQDLAA
jgi:hypothetical protein